MLCKVIIIIIKEKYKGHKKKNTIERAFWRICLPYLLTSTCEELLKYTLIAAARLFNFPNDGATGTFEREREGEIWIGLLGEDHARDEI